MALKPIGRFGSVVVSKRVILLTGKLHLRLQLLP